MPSSLPIINVSLAAKAFVISDSGLPISISFPHTGEARYGSLINVTLLDRTFATAKSPLAFLARTKNLASATAAVELVTVFTFPFATEIVVLEGLPPTVI